jgi:hypothetical protein
LPNTKNNQFKLCVGKGNNHTLVRSILKERWWWAISEKEDFDEVSFIWTAWKKNHLML